MTLPICDVKVKSSRKRVPTQGKSLVDFNPKIALQWHPSLNGSLSPNEVGHGCAKKVWWLCEVTEDHIWQATVNSRANGNGCPFCRGLKIVASNCLATTHPEIASEWHPTKNGSVTANDVYGGSGKTIWWLCKKHSHHEWVTKLRRRTVQKSGCPFCRESHGEKAVQKILQDKGYRHERQVRFGDCRYKYKLAFDFAFKVPGKAAALIEYQGAQHFSPLGYTGGVDNLPQVQIRDQIKRDYCNNHDIPLLEILYTEKNRIEEMVESFVHILPDASSMNGVELLFLDDGL